MKFSQIINEMTPAITNIHNFPKIRELVNHNSKFMDVKFDCSESYEDKGNFTLFFILKFYEAEGSSFFRLKITQEQGKIVEQEFVYPKFNKKHENLNKIRFKDLIDVKDIFKDKEKLQNHCVRIYNTYLEKM